jgi:hypothetical protein
LGDINDHFQLVITKAWQGTRQYHREYASKYTGQFSPEQYPSVLLTKAREVLTALHQHGLASAQFAAQLDTVARQNACLEGMLTEWESLLTPGFTARDPDQTIGQMMHLWVAEAMQEICRQAMTHQTNPHIALDDSISDNFPAAFRHFAANCTRERVMQLLVQKSKLNSAEIAEAQTWLTQSGLEIRDYATAPGPLPCDWSTAKPIGPEMTTVMFAFMQWRKHVLQVLFPKVVEAYGRYTSRGGSPATLSLARKHVNDMIEAIRTSERQLQATAAANMSLPIVLSNAVRKAAQDDPELQKMRATCLSYQRAMGSGEVLQNMSAEEINAEFEAMLADQI